MMVCNVLYISTPTYTGGAEISLLTLMRNLDPQRYKPMLVTSSENQLTGAARQYKIETLTQVFPWFRKRYPWRYPVSIARLAHTMREHQVALVHTNCDHSLQYVMHACRLCRLPYVSHVRDFVRAWFKPHSIVALRQAKCIIANSQAVATACVNAGLNPHRVVSIYNPVDLEQFKTISPERRFVIRAELGIPAEAVVIGIVGQIQPLKGHLELVQAAVELVSRLPMIHILIVGAVAPGISNEQFASDLQNRIMVSGYSENFHFTRFRYDIPAVMKSIDILAIPSWTEAFGRVAVEGMASGCAVIATRAGGLPEIVTHEQDGLLITPKNTEVLRIALERLTLDADLRLRLAQSGPRSARRFAVNLHVEQVQAVYDKVLTVERPLERE